MKTISRSERLGTSALTLALLAVGGLAWHLQTQPDLEVDASPLAALPERAGPWRAVDLPMDETVESILRADFHVQRTYLGFGGEFVWLYVGYYGTARGGRPEHTPRGCYTGAGWDIAATRVLEVDAGTGLRVNEYLVEQEGQRRLVQFWYRSHRRTGMLGGLDQNVDRLLGRLHDGRADGALVRLSTPVASDGEVAARGRLLSMAAYLDRQLADHWPEEHLPNGSG